jgi:hypothetical protein
MTAPVVGILFDTCLVRHHLTELLHLLPALRARTKIAVPAPQYAELVHHRELAMRVNAGPRKVKVFFADAALDPLLALAPVEPFSENDAVELAAWSARTYGSTRAYRARKKLAALRGCSDVVGHSVKARYKPDLDHPTWVSDEWSPLWAEMERGVRAFEHENKDAPTAADWLMIGMAVARGWHIATTETAKQTNEFEHLGDFLLDLPALRALVAGP